MRLLEAMGWVLDIVSVIGIDLVEVFTGPTRRQTAAREAPDGLACFVSATAHPRLRPGFVLAAVPHMTRSFCRRNEGLLEEIDLDGSRVLDESWLERVPLLGRQIANVQHGSHMTHTLRHQPFQRNIEEDLNWNAIVRKREGDSGANFNLFALRTYSHINDLHTIKAVDRSNLQQQPPRACFHASSHAFVFIIQVVLPSKFCFTLLLLVGSRV